MQMLTAKFDPHSFFRHTENVALHVPASEVFSLLRRSVNLPPQWGALVGQDSGDQVVVAAGGVVAAEDVEDILFVRLTAMEVNIAPAGGRSRDGFSFEANARFRVRVLPDRAEMAGFLRAVVGSRRVIQAESLTGYFESAVREALGQFVATNDAGELLGAAAIHQAGEAVAEALQVPLFSAGMSLDGSIGVMLESPAFRGVQRSRESATIRQAQHEAARDLNDSLRHAREEHLDRLAALLTRLREMAVESPGAELPKLIRTFAEHQRGQLYEALFAKETDANAPRWIVAVCSDELLYFDAGDSAQPARRMRIDGEAGAARSIQVADDGSLLIGASRGVYVWPFDAVEPRQVLLATTKGTPRGGFNSVVNAGGCVVASHSELGIREWDLSESRELKPRFEAITAKARAVRNLSHYDSAFYCSIDDVAVRWRAGDAAPQATFRGANAILSAIAPAADGLFAGTSEGDLLFWPAGTTSDPDLLQRGMARAIESIRVQELHGVRRLIYCDTSPCVHARVMGDNFTFNYEAGGQTLRRIEVAGDHLVAMNELRDRLIVWTAAHPSQPLRVIQVGAICGRSVQDFCLVPFEACA